MSGRQRISQFAKDLGQRRSEHGGNRIVVAGKGGVGKTTLTAILCHLYAREGWRVLAVDQDSQQNLAFSLGYPKDKASVLIPITKNVTYLEEKVGARPGEDWGMLLNLNPDVSDVVDRFGVHIAEGIDLLVMGGVVQAATGCLCPENALLGGLVRYVGLRQEEMIIMDAQAGLEPFGRSVADGFGTVILVTEPTFNSVQVALRIANLSRDMGIPRIILVVNKVRGHSDIDKVRALTKGFAFDSIHQLPYDNRVLRTEPDVTPLLADGGPFLEAAVGIKDAIY